jgi:uroporphyrinogen III methyltransferase / synthase
VAERPLQGTRIAVTRPREHAGALAERLEQLGAGVAVVPLIAIEPLEEDAEFAALVERGDHDWIVFTSANAVRAAGPRLRDARARAAAVGPATAQALRDAGVEPAFSPDVYAALEIAAGLEPLSGARVLLPQSEIAEPALADELRARGATVDAVDAYRTVPRDATEGELEDLRASDAVVLMSGSAARSLVQQGGAGSALLVCIGPKTAEAAREAGLQVGLIAHEATSEGIIQALTSHFGERE